MRAASRSLTRRVALSLAAASAALGLAACNGAESGGGAAEGDMTLGAEADAPVTVIEYASVTCGHCATWNATVWPEFRAKYVDTNRVRYVFREFPTPPQDIAVAGFLVARCAGDDSYFEVVDAIMRSQEEIFAGQGRAVLRRVAATAGLSDEQFTQCITDTDAITAMDARVRSAAGDGITSTPTFTVNGTRVIDSSLEGLSAAIDPLLPAGSAPAPTATPATAAPAAPAA